MISLKTEICQLFKIEYPIIQAGMAGGPTTVELVAEVSNAGSLGTLGAAYMTPDELRQAIKAIQSKTKNHLLLIFSLLPNKTTLPAYQKCNKH
ncbi:Enoyl-[acyl-carrier-protein] reductase [Planococcus halocryophilus Or1]|uniref:nitronate monooxygenase n=1 Tax=Planococcus halocryophilus TaxID=1215089 RepID=UPI0002B87824|nr:Enoyl-[acyl-carrier-protein] reductase [Planococcus halocryophilus Or1]